MLEDCITRLEQAAAHLATDVACRLLYGRLLGFERRCSQCPPDATIAISCNNSNNKIQQQQHNTDAAIATIPITTTIPM